MSKRLAAITMQIASIVLLCASTVWGDVDLAWTPASQTVPVGSVVEIGLYAVSDSEIDQPVWSMDVVLTWNPSVLEMVGVVDNGPYPWLQSAFFDDACLDGINNPPCTGDDDCPSGVLCDLLGAHCPPPHDDLAHCTYDGSPSNDGDAKYTALGNPMPAMATPEGLLVTTFQFVALAPTEQTYVVIEPVLGQYSVTQVFGGDNPNEDVTGELGDAEVAVVTPAGLSVGDVAVAPGRTAYVAVSGDIDGNPTFGVTVMLEIVPQPESTGTVAFTPSPPVDIFQLDDPWPGAGMFSPYDTNATLSDILNGSVDDNGTFLPQPVVFSGMLAAFPVLANVEAEGTWDVVLSTSVGDSYWEGVPTNLGQGTVRVVSLGDHDGDGWIDLLEFSQFQSCFTGSIGPVDPPGYPLAPGLCCSVFDFDEDGDVDVADYADFRAVMGGPNP